MKVNGNRVSPPRWALNFLSFLCPSALYEIIEGDLIEQFELDVLEVGRKKAQRRFLLQVLKFMRPGIILRNKFSLTLNQTCMWQSYLKISYRHLMKSKSFSFINVTGLAVGMAAAFLIIQYVSFEMSYDRHNKNSDLIYRVTHERYDDGILRYRKAQTFIPTGEALKNDYPEVIDYTTLFKISDQSEIIIRYESEDEETIKFSEENVYHVKGNFFNIFSLPVILGRSSENSVAPKTVLVSASIAKKYFGDVSPLGKVIHHPYGGEYKIAGVFKDVPANSHLKPDFLFAWESVSDETQGGDANNWHWDGFFTYILLSPSAQAETIENKLPQFSMKYLGHGEDRNRTGESKFRLQALTDIHLRSNLLGEASVNGNSTIVNILKVLALFVLIVAYINYINLSSAKAIDRAKEVGIRKIVGSRRSQLVGQFLVESLIINFAAGIFAIAIVSHLVTEYRTFLSLETSSILTEKKEFWVVSVSILLAGSIVSSLYPAFVISSFEPVKVLNGKSTFIGKGAVIDLRRGMVTFQFVLAIVLIAGTTGIYKQVNFLKNQDLGIDINQTLVLRTFVKFGPPGSDSIFLRKLELLKNELSAETRIKGSTASYDIPGKEHLSLFSNFRSVKNSEELISLYYSRVDYDFIPLFNAKLVAGRNFLKDMSTDQESIIINVEALKTFGFMKADDAIDQEVMLGRDVKNLRKIKVIGVVDFRSTSFKENNYPVVYQINWAPLRFLSIKFKDLKEKEELSESLAFIRLKWENLFPDKPFNYFFLDDFFNKQYEAEQKFSTILTLFTSLAIFIACLGLYGLSSLVTLQRNKEIGIRKILGASIQDLFLMLTKDFGILLVLAGIIALPIVWYSLSIWLGGYAHSTTLTWWIFVIPLIIMMIVVLITVGQQALKATIKNPVESLKHE